MRNEAIISVVIPALNEQQSIGKVVSAIPDWVDDIVVVDNGSRDATAEIAYRWRSSSLQRTAARLRSGLSPRHCPARCPGRGAVYGR